MIDEGVGCVYALLGRAYAFSGNPRLTLTITKEGDKLFGQMTGQGKLAVEPVSDTQFTIPEVKANISFEKDAAGKVVGLLLTQGTRTANAKKIK